MKKALSLLLALLMMVSVVGCAGESGKNPSQSSDATTTAAGDNTDPAETDDTFYQDRANTKDSLPDNLNFGDADVRVIARGENSKRRAATMEFFTEEDSTDGVNDAVLKRNASVEERLHVKLVLNDPGLDDRDLNDQLRTSVMSFSDDYDVSAAIGNIYEGMFLDLMALDYLDFDQPWWNPTFTQTTLVDGRLFSCAGELAISLMANNFITYFNKNVWADFHGDEDLYQIVRDGNFTLDKFTSLCNIYRDLNSDGLVDVDDLFGNVHPYETLHSVSWGAGSRINYTTYNEDDGTYSFTFLNDHTAQFIDKMRTLLFRNNYSYVSENNEMDTDEQLMSKIKNDTALFTLGKMYNVEYLRDMDSDFGIVPIPKFDEAQDSYNTTPEPGYSWFGVVTTSPAPDMSAAFLEASCAEAYRYVTPAYYDVAVKFKYTRDEQSAEMLDLCTAGILFDAAHILDGGGAILANIMINEKMLDKYVTYTEKKIKSIEAGMAENIELLRNIE